MKRPLVLASLVLSACSLDHVPPANIDPDVGPIALDAGTDAPCDPLHVVGQVDIAAGRREIDVLIAVDGSPAMVGIDPAVRGRVVDLVRDLAAGEAPIDGIDHFGALPIRVGVIGMAAEAWGVPGCDGDRSFHASARTDDLDCARDPVSATTFGTFYRDVRSSFSADELVRDVDCAMRVGTNGCPITAGFDAIAAALATSRELIQLGGYPVVIVITAQDDCSTVHAEDAAQLLASGVPPAVACLQRQSLLATPSDAARRMAELLDGPSTWLVIAGTPRDFTPGEDDVSLAPMLDANGDIVPACASASAFHAAPASRWAQLERSLDASDPFLTSVCGAPTAPLLTGPLHVDEGLAAVCIEPPPEIDAAGLARCEVRVTLPPLDSNAPERHCADLFHPEAYTSLGTETFELDGRTGPAEVCLMHQLTRSELTTGAGWIYQDGPIDGLPTAECRPLIRLHDVTVHAGRITILCDDGTTCAAQP